MATLTNLKENKTLFIPHNCKNEILVIEYDHSLKVASFAIYEKRINYKKKLSIWQRIRYSYYVLLNKKPYADRIKLNKNQLLELYKFLDSLDY